MLVPGPHPDVGGGVGAGGVGVSVGGVGHDGSEALAIQSTAGVVAAGGEHDGSLGVALQSTGGGIVLALSDMEVAGHVALASITEPSGHICFKVLQT